MLIEERRDEARGEIVRSMGFPSSSLRGFVIGRASAAWNEEEVESGRR